MKINFSNAQFKALMKIVFLGNHIVNGPRVDDEIIKEFKEIEQYIYSFHNDFKLDNWIDKNKVDIEFFPTSELEDEVMDYIEFYDDDVFHEELIYNLGRRDFINQYGEENIQKMDLKERIEKEHPFIEKYYNEIEKNNLKNIGINS